jgi:hypothetical protein
MQEGKSDWDEIMEVKPIKELLLKVAELTITLEDLGTTVYHGESEIDNLKSGELTINQLEAVMLIKKNLKVLQHGLWIAKSQIDDFRQYGLTSELKQR